MQRTKRIVLAIGAGLLMIVAVFWSKDVVQGANEGLDLCLKVIIPSIFPFLFFSMLLTNYWKSFNIPLLNPLCKVTGIPTSTQSILLLSLIGGYPVGAQAVVQAYKNHTISETQANRLMGFCNNAGPSFLFGLMGAFFENKFATVLLWLIHIGSALLIGAILPGKSNKANIPSKENELGVAQILRTALQVTATICGWVLIFRIVISLLENWSQHFTPVTRVILYGMLELSNGCTALSQITSESMRFVIAALLLSAGGICVLMQTKSVTGELGPGLYFPGKIMQSSASVFLASLICPLIYRENVHFAILIISLVCFLITFFVLKSKKVVALCC